MNLRQLLPFLRTLVHLRPEQIYYRGWYALRARLRIDRLMNGGLPAGSPSWVPLPFHAEPLNQAGLDAGSIVLGRFRFLNESVDFGAEIDWAAPGKGRLWRYNLHYFDVLFAGDGPLPAETAARLMHHWVEHNPPGTADAWDPFPTSLRLVNWVKYLSISGKPGLGDWDELAGSLWVQAGWLERSVEYHLLGNHLFKNGKALVFAGLFFRGWDGERWLEKGLRILGREIEEQVLQDGGHFERSPMYHAMILEDCLDLLNVCGGDEGGQCRTVAKKLGEVVPGMVRFLVGMSHPDGDIALFNDAALGIEARVEELVEYAERVLGERQSRTTESQRHREDPQRNIDLDRGDTVTNETVVSSVKPSVPPCLCGSRSFSFPESGYFILSPTQEDKLIIDCGPVGPDYQPGHSHCDTLSFELSLKGRRVIVDSGCCQYEDGEIRRYNRGNAGHNTLTVDNQNQSEVWGAHRCARRARPLYAKIEEQPDGALVFEGAHDGYMRLKGRPVHHRRVVWRGNEIRIEDRLEGSGVHDIESRLHIHPDLDVKLNENRAVVSAGGELIAVILPSNDENVELSDGWYCPEFGKRLSCVVVRVKSVQCRLPYSGGWNIRVQ